MSIYAVILTFFVTVGFFAASSSIEADDSYPAVFRAATEAYLDNEWSRCVTLFEKSLKEFARYQNVIIECRRKCKTDVLPETDDFEDDLLERFFEATIRNSLCLLKCEQRGNNTPVITDKQLEQDFIDRTPYDYLQLCYFKIGDISKAASSAYTFLQHNPEHDVMRHNLNYYLGLPGIDRASIKYLELQEYQKQYLSAAQAYSSGRNEEVVQSMEECLKMYFEAEKDCRLLCEGGLAAPPFTSLLVTVANHYTYALRCKLRCPYQLVLFSGEYDQDLIANILHYLQFAYYKVGQLEKACQAVASYLLFKPDDSIMLENKRFYSNLSPSKPEWFTPNKDVLRYHKRFEKMHKTLEYIDEAFNFSMDSLLPQHQMGISTVMSKGDIRKGIIEPGVKITMAEDELGAKQRFVADGLTTDLQCSRLMRLAQSGATLGDGYNGSHSPHTEFESFEGLTIGKAITMLQAGNLTASDVILLLDMSEKARRVVESGFNLTSNLHFAYTHLVCRTAKPELAETRSSSDLSHPIHADNCLLTPRGQCLKQRPAYIWRDYSAILYLNEDFEGGHFFFAQPKEQEVQPHCGRLVAFSAGHENLHGVRAVVKGRRCALAMWYTLNPRHQEKERHIATQAAVERLKTEEIEERKSHARTDL